MAKKQKLSSLLTESQGNVADRFDDLEDATRIVVFETSKEIGIYRQNQESQDITDMRTRVSGEETPQMMTSLSKRTFYRQSMLTVLCTSEVKKGRPINYYGI